MEFNIGDRVRIVDLGHMYDYSEGDAIEMGLMKWRKGEMPITEDWENYIPEEHEHENKAIVVGTLRKGSYLLVAIRWSDGFEYIIENRGIERCQQLIILGDDLFVD